MHFRLRQLTSRTLLAFAALVWFCPGGVMLAVAQGPGLGRDQPQADFAGLDIQAVAGWDGRVDLAAPVPLSFLISNQSAQALEGQLILRDRITKREVRLGDVFIGAASVRRFSAVQGMSDWEDCVATYADGDRVLATRILPLVTGKDFSEDVNYLLFVDDSGRALQMPTPETASDSEMPLADSVVMEQGGTAISGGPASNFDASRFTPSPGTGRAVQPVSARTWQIPQHPGPLTVIQAMLFSDVVRPDMLNEKQWDAIGRWICLGGTVFVHDSSKDLLDHLKTAVSLTLAPPVSLDGLRVHRCGAGAIREYSGKLFSAEETTSVRTVLVAAGKLSRSGILSVLTDDATRYRSSSSADRTRMLVIAVFVIYTLFSGVGTLLLSRATRRRVAFYTCSVVLLACMAAAVLGGVLRTSRGDLHWHSVTQASPGGLIQVAGIQVQSAGGRNTEIAVQGRNADLQLLEDTNPNYSRDQYYFRLQQYGPSYYEEITAPGYPAFSEQSNRLSDVPDAFGIRVPITPWGRRQCTAAAFESAIRGLDVTLKFLAGAPSTEQTMSTVGPDVSVRGQWSVEVRSSLPFDLSDCSLVLMTCRAAVPGETGDRQFPGLLVPYGSPITKFIPLEHHIPIGDLPAAASRNGVAENAIFRNQHQIDHRWDTVSDSIRPAYNGSTGAWIFGRILNSPLLSIDEAHSDFVPLSEKHEFIQEIPPEQLPAEWIELHQDWLDLQLRRADERPGIPPGG